MATDLKERREQVLRYLKAHANEWVDGTELANEKVGGSEGLRRVRELREAEHGGHRIVTRPHPDRTRSIFQYKLADPDPVLQHQLDDLMAQVPAVSEHPQPAPEPPPPMVTPGMANRQMLMVYNKETDRYELTKEVCVECGGMYDDDLTHRTTDAKHLRWEEAHKAQLTIGVPEQPAPFKFTEMPKKLDLSRMTICPRCRGYRRPGRERFNRKKGEIVKTEAEEFSRDPFRPTIKGEPNPCERCGGFGVIPQHIDQSPQGATDGTSAG